MKRDLYVVAKFLAFVAVMLVGIIAILNLFLPDNVTATLNIIKDIALIIGVVFSGWTFTVQLKPAKFWRIAYIVAAVICLLGVLKVILS